MSQQVMSETVSLDIPRVKRSVKQFPTGSRYEGTWDVLGMSGFGTYIFPNGVVYEGELDDGMFHGVGELRYPCGAIIRGKWKKGELIERKLIFADGLEYAEENWKYCRMPDRRFSIEYEEGLQPAGRSYLTPSQPTEEVPPGYYDTIDGFYDSKTQMVYKKDDLTAIIRAPCERERTWIVDNCRTSPEKPLGPCPGLYEEWLDADLRPKSPPAPAAATSRVPAATYTSSFAAVHEVETNKDPDRRWKPLQSSSLRRQRSVLYFLPMTSKNDV